MRYTVVPSPPSPARCRTRNVVAVESNASASSTVPPAPRSVRRRDGRRARVESTCGGVANPAAAILRSFARYRATAAGPAAPPAAGGAAHAEPPERGRVLRDELGVNGVPKRLEQIVHGVGGRAVAVHRPRSRVLPREHDRIGAFGDRDRVHVAGPQGRERERARDRVGTAGEELARAPEQEEDGERSRDDFQVLGTHTDDSPASGRYVRRVISRRRNRHRLPATMSSTGMPTTLPYFTASRLVALVNTSWGGARFFERMPINASSCASQSIAFCTNTRFSGEFCA